VYEKKNHERYLTDTEPIMSVNELLADAEKAIRDGDGRYAYELSLQATQAAPENLDAWFLRASLAPSMEERILCINRLNELEPDHQDKHNVAFFTLKELLDHDPFLAYLEETDGLYRVFNADRMVLSIPKRRSVTTLYPDDQINKLTAARRWLMLAIFGLLLAGIGTVIFAPIAAWTAINAGQSIRSRSGRVNSTVMLFAAMTLFVIGLIFSLLFIMHLIG